MYVLYIHIYTQIYVYIHVYMFIYVYVSFTHVCISSNSTRHTTKLITTRCTCTHTHTYTLLHSVLAILHSNFFFFDTSMRQTKPENTRSTTCSAVSHILHAEMRKNVDVDLHRVREKNTGTACREVSQRGIMAAYTYAFILIYIHTYCMYGSTEF